MKKLLITALLLIVSVVAFAAPESARGPSFSYLYDGLNSNGSIVGLHKANALHLRVGAYLVGELHQAYDEDGEKYDLYPDDSNSCFHTVPIPFDVGYNYNDIVQVDVGFQLMKWFSTSVSDDIPTVRELGFGDVWIKVHSFFPIGEKWLIAPRLGFKLATGNDEKMLGDGQQDIDLGFNISVLPDESRFRANATLGLRYRFPKTIEDNNVFYDYTPGIHLYSRVEPGMRLSSNFDCFGVLNFVHTAKSKAEPEPTDGFGGTKSAGLSVGVRPIYTLNNHNAISVEFLYPVLGENVRAELLFGVNYDMYIPL